MKVMKNWVDSCSCNLSTFKNPQMLPFFSLKFKTYFKFIALLIFHKGNFQTKDRKSQRKAFDVENYLQLQQKLFKNRQHEIANSDFIELTISS